MAHHDSKNRGSKAKTVSACTKCEMYTNNLVRGEFPYNDWHKGCGGFFTWTTLNLITGVLEYVLDAKGNRALMRY